jgi:hypothetical protein
MCSRLMTFVNVDYGRSYIYNLNWCIDIHARVFVLARVKPLQHSMLRLMPSKPHGCTYLTFGDAHKEAYEVDCTM